MLKNLGVLTIVAIAAIGVSGQPNKASNKERQNSANRQPSAVTPDSAEKHKSSNADQTEPNPDSPKWYESLERPEWWLVILGFPTLVFVGWQAWETRKSASAALLNAQALVNSERPWMVITIEHSPSVFQDDVFTIKAINRGRSPAEVISRSENCLIVKGEGQMPPEPMYTETGTLRNSQIVVTEGEFTLETVSEGYLHQMCESEEMFAELKSFTRQAYIFGQIVYRDLIKGDEHRTRWCCMYFPGHPRCTFVHSGPSGYNTHT